MYLKSLVMKSIKSGELKGYEKDWKINGEAVKLAVEKQ